MNGGIEAQIRVRNRRPKTNGSSLAIFHPPSYLIPANTTMDSLPIDSVRLSICPAVSGTVVRKHKKNPERRGKPLPPDMTQPLQWKSHIHRAGEGFCPPQDPQTQITYMSALASASACSLGLIPGASTLASSAGAVSAPS